VFLVQLLVWSVMILIKFSLAFLGLFVVAVAIYLDGDNSDNWPDSFWLWGNSEEAVPEWWKATGKSSWWWYAVRNPVNNMRFLFDEVSLSDCTVRTNWDVHIPMEAAEMLEAGQASAYYFIQYKWMAAYLSMCGL